MNFNTRPPSTTHGSTFNTMTVALIERIVVSFYFETRNFGDGLNSTNDIGTVFVLINFRPIDISMNHVVEAHLLSIYSVELPTESSKRDFP